MTATLGSFAASAPLTLGVELELQVVDRHAFDLTPGAGDLLRLLARRELAGTVSPEITESMIELGTAVCRNHAEVLAQLRALRDALGGAAARLNLGICGGGTHPFQQWSERRISDTPRYHELSALYGYLTKQFTVFGQHVHVGCTGADAALALLHGLSRFIPHLIALSASSPFVQGVDTGFDSARLNSVAAFPMAGRAPFITRWDDFEAWFQRMAGTGIVRSMKDFYWDIRPKPEYGTVEVRVLDTPLTIDKAAALAALVQCLAHWLQEERPFALREDDYLPYAFNRFQACRFGLEGVYVDPTTGEHRRLGSDVTALFETLAPHAAILGARDALALLRAAVAAEGNDAAWLRAVQQRERLLPATVRAQCTRWIGEPSTPS